GSKPTAAPHWGERTVAIRPPSLPIPHLAATLSPWQRGQNRMDMTGERRIPAPRQIVWDALNNADVLKASIPGCESLDKTSDTTMTAKAGIKLGPISAKFSGNVTLSDIDAPNSYTIGGEGQGGVAGFAKGGAKVTLTDDGDGTLLSYTVNAQVGGKIAQLGARLIDATAKQMAGQFFDRFTEQVTALMPAAPEAAEAPPEAAPAPDMTPPPSMIPVSALIPREAFGLPIVAWAGIGAFAVLAVLLLAGMFK
ncbi:MAG: carbon monoxide dehydrogenase subunit G, partial [Rhodospirillales bacterium]